MKKLRNNKIRKLLAFMVALALMVSCMPSAYTISASEAFGDGTEDIFTDGEITSEPAAEESTPDVSSADQEETEQAQQSTLTYENDSVKVTAEALEDGALPQNTALKADSVNENSSVSYDTVSQKLSAAATDKGSSLRGFFAYDVYFADGDGNRVEPNGRVRVTFEYKTPAAPELTDAASTSVTVEKLHYNSSTGDTDVNTLQANEDLKVLNVNEGKQIQTLQVETGNAAVFAVMWDSPETADVEAEAVSGNEDEVSIASEELTDGMDISDEPEQDAAETPAAENPEVTPDAEPSEAPAENPDAEPTEAPAEDPDVVEEPAEDIASPEEVPAADENGETSLIEVLGDDTNLRVSPSIEAEVLATVNAGTQLTLLDTVTAEDGATWYKVSWEGTEAYIRSDMAQVVDSSDEAEEVEDVLESEEVSYSQEVGNVVVTATAAKGVIPEGAQFVVTPIEKGSDQYADIEKQLHEGAENESYTVAGFLAYDISFLNDDGTKIEPQNGSVRVSIAYKEAEIPEDVAETDTAQENMNVSLVHFVEDANGNVTEVVNMSNDGQAEVSTTDNGEIESANFETESFSTFSVVWLADDFTSVQTTSSYGTESTVDSAASGITINMFNYDTDKINTNHSLKFSDGKGQSDDYNNWTGSATPRTDIMKNTLGSGSYPTLNKGNKESTSYLFSTASGTGKEVYPDANYLFKKDADGYYEYDSATNFAQFDEKTKKFTVYKVPGSCSSAVDLQTDPKHGSFFPFNTLGNSTYRGIYEISGNPDFHFGMTMSAKFIQPKDGKIKDNDMVFEFSGDDDVWVYIDGVLVLDIGGIHNASSGSINFADGTATVGTKTKNLKTLFENANKTGDFVSGENRFADYTMHTINFYYLERGAGDSNCKLKFNLPTVPKKSVTVEKQLSNTDKEKYADVLSMCTAVFADETSATTATGSITVTGLTANDNTTLKVYKVVGFDENISDWTIEDWANNYATNTNHVVNINWEALKSVNPLPNPVKEINVSENQTTVTIDGLEIGAYMIIATGTHTIYNVMGEAPYGYDANNLIVPAAKTINAKSSAYQLTKTLVNGDQIFVAKGEEVKFNIDTTFPSYALNATNRAFWIKDTPTGMKITGIKVLVNGSEVKVNDAYTLDKKLATTEAVTVNFKDTYIGSANLHAGQSVSVEVTGVITDDTEYKNEAETNNSHDKPNVPGYSGSIRINKTDDSKENPKALKGATFQIKKQGENAPIQFVKTNTGVYTMVTSDTDMTDKTAVADVEATEGTVLVKGLGAGTYVITETKAPKGYSINTNIDNVTLTKDSAETRNVTLSVTDTKLGALPSTGGMGTYLFTIIGVVVMAGAAGAFFISRRKGSEE